MSSATKLALVDKLLPLLEAFGSSRRLQSELRKQMKEAACTHESREQLVEDQSGDSFLKVVPCFDSSLGRTPWCDACRQHDQLFARLMAERKSNKLRLLKIERLAVAYAKPEEPEPPEPKALLELIERQEKEEEAAS